MPYRLPQLLPYLNQGLHLPGTRQAVVDQAAILEGAFIEVPHPVRAEVREVVPELLQLFLGQNIRFLRIGTPGHHSDTISNSLFVRHTIILTPLVTKQLAEEDGRTGILYANSVKLSDTQLVADRSIPGLASLNLHADFNVQWRPVRITGVARRAVLQKREVQQINQAC